MYRCKIDGHTENFDNYFLKFVYFFFFFFFFAVFLSVLFFLSASSLSCISSFMGEEFGLETGWLWKVGGRFILTKSAFTIFCEEQPGPLDHKATIAAWLNLSPEERYPYLMRGYILQQQEVDRVADEIANAAGMKAKGPAMGQL